MEWSNDTTLEFLDLYEGEPVIWNPEEEHHRDRHQVHDAWKRIQSKFSKECSLLVLKKKKDCLMATYRKLTLKVKKSEAGVGTPYKPEWFAYDKMAAFMRLIYTPRVEIKYLEENTEHSEDPDDYVQEEEIDEPEWVEDSKITVSEFDSLGQQDEVTRPGKRKASAMSSSRSDKVKWARIDNGDEPGHENGFGYHDQGEVKVTTTGNADEFTSFGQYVASKLRRLRSRRAASIAQNRIINYLFALEMGNNDVELE